MSTIQSQIQEEQCGFCPATLDQMDGWSDGRSETLLKCDALAFLKNPVLKVSPGVRTTEQSHLRLS